MSADAEELVGLGSWQTWRTAAWLRYDPEDDHAGRGVPSMLARFATGVMLDAGDTRLVLARIGVATWSHCPEDAAFWNA